MTDFSCNACHFTDSNYLPNTCAPNFHAFMTLVNLLLTTNCNISDPCRRVGKESDYLQDGAEYDFIVVGAGVAGSVVMARLSEDRSISVLGLEAGPEEPTVTMIPGFAVAAVGSELDWKFKTEKESKACLNSDGVCNWPRGKMVSGTGGMQGMMYTRGHHSIYDEWGRNNPGWSFQEVLPYFKKAENNRNPDIVDKEYHGFDGPLYVQRFIQHPKLAEDVVEAGEELGYVKGDVNGRNQSGVTIAQMMVKDSLRGSTSRLYLRPAYRRTNLHLAINAHVTKVILSPTTKTAIGVEYVDANNHRRIVYAKKEVILSAGAIGSPQILMLSGIGPKEDLEKHRITVKVDLPVGKNLHNHVSIGIHFTIDDQWTSSLTNESINDFIEYRNGSLASTSLTQTTAFLKSKYSENGIPDLQVFFDGYGTYCSATGSPKECPDGKIETCPPRQISARPTTVLPRSKGYLTLRDEQYTSPPIIKPNYFQDRRDLEILVEGIKIIIQMTKTEALKKYNFKLVEDKIKGCENEDFGTDKYWECLIMRDTGPENHQAGTCKMGPAKDPTAVVNHELKVHGIKNLRVIDASVFPMAPNSNPIATIIMAAEKISADIKRSLYHTSSGGGKQGVSYLVIMLTCFVTMCQRLM